GSLFFEAGDGPRWCMVWSARSRQPAPGVVTVELRLDQTAVDHRPQLGIYWGDTMRRDGIIVNAPYTPPFNMDRSLASTMERTIRLEKIGVHQTRRGARLSASLQAVQPPGRVAYRVRVRTGGAWVDARDDITL